MAHANANQLSCSFRIFHMHKALNSQLSFTDFKIPSSLMYTNQNKDNRLKHLQYRHPLPYFTLQN